MQNFVKIREKKILAAQWSKNGPKMSKKNFFSDFDEILRGNSQKYGD